MPEGDVEWLRNEQAKRCVYGTREGDGRTCDCKFGIALLPDHQPRGEVTGCPELRAALWVLAPTQPDARATAREARKEDADA